MSPKIKDKEDEISTAEKCETCDTLREVQTPIVDCVNISKSDVFYDRTLFIFKLIDSKPSGSEEQKKPPRQMDRFEESKLWEIIGLNKKYYEKLPAILKKVSSDKLVFNKCIYRLHNTRHFSVPLNKKEKIQKDYEDDRKLIKRNQSFDCPWEGCPHSFRDPQDMRIHYMFDHESVKLFCCGEKFENYEDYVCHYLTDPPSQGHFTWSARECWGCSRRFSDALEFYKHAKICEAQLNPFKCPDPLCPIRFEYLSEAVDHFYAWHHEAGSIIWNGITYPDRESIRPDIPLLDDGQLVLQFPMTASYECKLCLVKFSSEQFFTEHISSHVRIPRLWLIPSLIRCSQCKTSSCTFQLDQLLEVLPRLLNFIENPNPIPNFEKHPILLIWHLFFTQEYVNVLKIIWNKLLSESRRIGLKGAEPTVDHVPFDGKKLAGILDSIFYLYSFDFKMAEGLKVESNRVLSEMFD